MAKKLEYMKGPMIPGARKESHIAGNPKAHFSVWPGRRFPVISRKIFFPLHKEFVRLNGR
jgi:hypothetical protein